MPIEIFEEILWYFNFDSDDNNFWQMLGNRKKFFIKYFFRNSGYNIL